MAEKKIIGFSSILAACGTALAICNMPVYGGILIALGVIGAIVDYCLEVHNKVKEQEEKDKLYEGIKQTVESISLINTGQNENKTMH